MAGQMSKTTDSLLLCVSVGNARASAKAPPSNAQLNASSIQQYLVFYLTDGRVREFRAGLLTIISCVISDIRRLRRVDGSYQTLS